MSIHSTQAIVLDRYDVRETSIIVNFYTSSFGKITGLLKGIRKEPAKFGSAVQPFSSNDIVFYRKRNSAVHLVSQCDLKDDFSRLRTDIAKIALASVAVEIINTVMAQEEQNPEVFDLLLATLLELAATHNPEKIMAIFKIKILALSGFKPQLDSCVQCGSKIAAQSKFSMNLGGLLCDRCWGRDLASRSIFRGTIATILHIERNDFKSNLNLGLNPQIKKELNLVLDSFLNFHLEKELKSQKVLTTLSGG